MTPRNAGGNQAASEGAIRPLTLDLGVAKLIKSSWTAPLPLSIRKIKLERKKESQNSPSLALPQVDAVTTSILQMSKQTLKGHMAKSRQIQDSHPGYLTPTLHLCSITHYTSGNQGER